MANGNEVVGIEVVAELQNLRQQFAEIPKVADEETKALTAAVNKNIKALESQIAKAAKTTKAARAETRELARDLDDAADSSRNLGDAAGAAGGTLAKLAGGADLVSPVLGEIIRGGADLADVFEVASGVGTGFASTLASLVPVLSIAAAGIAAMVAVVDDYADSKREATRAEEQFKAAIQPLEDALAAARSEHELLTQAQAAGGEELRAYVEIAELHASVDGKVAESTKALREEREQLAAQLKEISDQNGFDARLAKGRLAQLDEEIGAAESHGRELKRLGEESRALKDALDQRTESTKRSIKADTDAAKAASEFDAQVAALRESLAKRKEEQELEANVIQISDDSEWRAIHARIEAEQELDKVREEAAKRQSERLKELAEEERAADAAVLQGQADLFGAIETIASSSREQMSEEDRDAAATAFAIEKAAAMSQAAVNAALGISEAAASAPPPLNAIPIAAATAQGIANTIAVASVPAPTFNDTPGVQQMGTRGNVSLGAGDYFAAARDPAELRRQVNEGAPSDPFSDYQTGGPSVTLIGARAFGRFIRDDVRMRTPLARAVYAKRVLGQRRRTR